MFVEAAVANGAYLLDNMWVQVVRRDSAVYERLHMPGAPVGEELVALRAGAAGEWWPPPLDAQGSSTALEEAERSFDGCLVPRESAWLGLEPDRARGE